MDASKIHNAIKVCNIKGPKVVYKSACIVTMVAFVKKRFFVGTYVSFKSAFVVTLVTLKKKMCLVSPQVSFKTKYIVTLVAFDEGKRFFESLSL